MSVTWADGIVITLEVAFTTDPLATSVWTDVSKWLREVPGISHGKTTEEGEIGPSTMTVVLANRDRRFDPDHATGPYFPNLLPMKAIRYRVQLGAFTKTLFTGYVQGWPQRWHRRFDGDVQIQAISGTRLLNNAELPGSAYEVEVLADNPVGYWPFQDGDLTGSVGDDMKNVTQSEVGSGGPLGAPVGVDGSTTVSETGTGVFAVDDPGLVANEAIEAWVTSDGDMTNTVLFQSAISTTSWIALAVNFGFVHAGYSDASDNLRVTSGGSGLLPASNIPTGGVHHVAALRSGSNLLVMINGSVVATFALAAGTKTTTTTTAIPGHVIGITRSIATDPANTWSNFASYEAAPTVGRFDAHSQVGRWAWTGSHGDFGWEYGGARINRILDDIGWPAALRDIDAGQTLCGPYLPARQNPLSALRDVERAECGLLYFNADGELAFRDRQSLWTTADTGTIFSDDGAPGAVEITDLVPDGNTVETVRNIVTTSYSDVGAITRRDQPSIDAYTESPQSDTCPTIPTADVASLRSAYILRERKDPQTRITSLVCRLRGPVGSTAITTQVTKVLALELGQVVTVEHTPMGIGAQSVKKVMVLGIRHQVSRKPMQWTTTLYLSPPPTSAEDAPYLVLGDPVLGVIGAAAGNLIPY